jgi:hypothetical protein
VPRISAFYGITIWMYWNEGRHARAHFHARYGGRAASIDLDVQCPAGHSIVSGGWTIISGAAVPFVDKSYSGTEWSVGVDNFDGVLSAEATAHAWCAPTGAAVVARASTASVSTQRSRDERRQRAAH